MHSAGLELLSLEFADEGKLPLATFINLGYAECHKASTAPVTQKYERQTQATHSRSLEPARAAPHLRGCGPHDAQRDRAGT